MAAQSVPVATQYEQPQFVSSIPTDLMTVPEAAAAIRVNVHTLRRWIQIGLVPTYRLINGRDVRVSLATLVYPIPRKATPKRNLVESDAGLRVRIDPRPRLNPTQRAAGSIETKI